MQYAEPIAAGREVEVTYDQFHMPRWLRAAIRVVGVLTWPVVLPLALLGRLSDLTFVTCAELLALVPYLPGTVIRGEYYRLTLASCGSNVMIGFGTVFRYRNVNVGDHVLIGMYNVVHHCDFGSYVLTGEGCRFLSGRHYHHYDRLDMPIAMQGGCLRRISVGSDCWIGANAVVMDDVAGGSVVGAGAVVTAPVSSMAVVAGNPARMLRTREPIARRRR